MPAAIIDPTATSDCGPPASCTIFRDAGYERSGDGKDRSEDGDGPCFLRASHLARGFGVQVIHDAMHDRVDGDKPPP